MHKIRSQTATNSIYKRSSRVSEEMGTRTMYKTVLSIGTVMAAVHISRIIFANDVGSLSNSKGSKISTGDWLVVHSHHRTTISFLSFDTLLL